MLAALANLFLAVVFYALMLLFRDFEKYHIPAVVAVLVTNIVYALTLIFSKVRERF